MAQGNGYFSDWLEDNPEEAYYSATPFAGGTSPLQQKYWGGQMGNVMREYQGMLGSAVRRGEMPSLTFTDFLSQNPWTVRYMAGGPSMRAGGRTSQFAPAARYMY